MALGQPHERVVQCHLAGHTNMGTHIIDTHDGPVIDPVWELYARAHQLTGGMSTLLEWDSRIPPFPEVHAEVLKAKQVIAEDAGTSTTSLSTGSTPVETDPAGSTVPHPAVLVAAEYE